MVLGEELVAMAKARQGPIMLLSTDLVRTVDRAWSYLLHSCFISQSFSLSVSTE